MEFTLHNKFFTYGLIVIVTFILTFLAIRILRFFLNRFFNLSSLHLRVDPTRYKFVKNAASSVIILLGIIAVFYSIPELRAIGLTLFAGAGIFAAIIGFASQAAFANIISGIFIVIYKPFRVGDVVTISQVYTGFIEDITLRHTVIRNFENQRIIIPNTMIGAETIQNSTIADSKVCNFIEIGISYDSDVDKAIRIIQEESMKHPDFIDNRTNEEIEKGFPPVIVRMLGFGNSSVNLRAYVWSIDLVAGFAMKCDLNKSIKARFDKEDIEIPYPYRNLIIKNKNQIDEKEN